MRTITDFKIRIFLGPPSIDMENLNNANIRAQTQSTYETADIPQNQTKILTDSGFETLMTPRKEILVCFSIFKDKFFYSFSHLPILSNL